MDLKDIDTSEFVSYNGHAATCMCAACLSADIDAAAQRQGINVAAISLHNGEDIAPTRTRYAKPGQSCGHGVVRTVSPKQIAFMKSLLDSRDTSGLTRLPGSEDIENMSLRGARDLIDRLLACPMKANTLAPTARPATEPMKAFLRKLIAERVSDKEFSVETISFDNARKAIEYLKGQPVSSPKITDGMYLKDGVIYKVQRAVHGSGNLYAKKLMPESKTFEYAPGAVTLLTIADRMTLEQAKEYSALYGMCVRCAKTLTKEESIARSMGDVCASKF